MTIPDFDAGDVVELSFLIAFFSRSQRSLGTSRSVPLSDVRRSQRSRRFPCAGRRRRDCAKRLPVLSQEMLPVRETISIIPRQSLWSMKSAFSGGGSRARRNRGRRSREKTAAYLFFPADRTDRIRTFRPCRCEYKDILFFPVVHVGRALVSSTIRLPPAFLNLTAGYSPSVTQQHEAARNHGVGICHWRRKRFAKFIVEGFFPAGDDAGGNPKRVRFQYHILGAAEGIGNAVQKVRRSKDRTYGGRTVNPLFMLGSSITLGCSADV